MYGILYIYSSEETYLTRHDPCCNLGLACLCARRLAPGVPMMYQGLGYEVRMARKTMEKM